MPIGGGDGHGQKSQEAYLIFLGSNLISWISNKQPTVPWSTTESEYRSVADTAAELEWIKMVLEELGHPHTTPMAIFCVNSSAVALSSNPTFRWPFCNELSFCLWKSRGQDTWNTVCSVRRSSCRFVNKGNSKSRISLSPIQAYRRTATWTERVY